MLDGIHPLLTGELLRHLDEMGHGDTLVVADAHFPTARLGARTITLAGVEGPHILQAIRTVLPVEGAVEVMAAQGGGLLAVHREYAPDAPGPVPVGRFEFYERAEAAYLIVRSGDIRPFANALVRKGLATPLAAGRRPGPGSG